MQGIASPRDDQAPASAVTLRPVRPEDMEFLFRVYASTRDDEMTLLDWSSAEKQTFLRMQFHAQHQYYHAQFRDARFDVIERDAQPVGRLYVDRRADTINIIDIALLPEHRRVGIGSLLLRALLAEANASGLSVSIHVERKNPALRWYERQGFVRVSDQGIYYFMRWSPAPISENPVRHRAAE
ncbi:MAG TPA: GNAT family N-acetyltransferase [Candidatus Methylomirabilis sp.]|nr:GNAT family N-acetyltransferase [Candidatus Methylomirabilis sp.]